MQLQTAQVATPLGTLFLCATSAGLAALSFGDPEVVHAALARRFGDEPLEYASARDPHGACTALRAYLGGELDAIDALPVDAGGTPFQRAVWTALREIPVGRTATYSGLAATVGRPTAVRAVGAANGQNPVALVVPCHRVIAADGKLQGYGGGLDKKRWLLVHEKALLV
jgi:methylated-DNA-[protein]-cysteine S-methyltransferase